MKRPVVIFRFGNQEPVLADIKAMQILTDGTMLAMGCNTPFGVASVVITDRTHAEILEVFKEAADEHDDILPLMVFNYGDVSLHFPFGGVEGMLECVPQFVETSSFGSGSGKTPIACEPTNSVDVSGSVLSFYRCIASASRASVLSDFTLTGTSSDTGGEYSGSLRKNYSTTTLTDPNRITHESKITVSGSLQTDFILDIVPGGAYNDTPLKNKLVVYKCGVPSGNDAAIAAIAERFRKIMCNCLKNGQFFNLSVEVICPTTGTKTTQGVIKFRKCFGKCTVEAKYDTSTGGIPRVPNVNESGKAYGASATHEFDWASSNFSIEISSVTGSEPIGSGSGALTASFTPFLTVPSAQTSATTFYPFNGALTGSYLQNVPGLIYFDSLNSTLNLYNGSGSWASFTAATGSISKYTTTIGDDSATSFTVTHSKGTRDVVVTVRETAAPYELVFPTIRAVTTNTIQVDFGIEVPTSNEYTVIVI